MSNFGNGPPSTRWVRGPDGARGTGWGADGSYPPPLMFDAWQTWGVQVRNLQLGTLPNRGWAVGRLAW